MEIAAGNRPFHVALTADFFAGGKPVYADVGLSLFESIPAIRWQPFAEHRPEIAAEQTTGANGIIVLAPKVTAHSVSASENLLAIGRFGVGYDSVDVPACTDREVLVYITAGAVDRSVAEATIGWMISLLHHAPVKDRLVRQGKWDERSGYMGKELRDRTIGLIGFDGIAQAVARLLGVFGPGRILAFDPYIDAAKARSLNVEPVPMQALLRESEIVSIHSPLTPATRNLIAAPQLAMMRPDAYLINTARGGIVDEDALYAALRDRRLAGAAMDCFVGEPITQPHRFGEFENVLLAPHSIAWTEELFRDIGRAACQGMIDLACGIKPRGVVNPELLKRKSFIDKWSRLIGSRVNLSST
jgi:phosphoglycerate dehydrogenase-like enzyme